MDKDKVVDKIEKINVINIEKGSTIIVHINTTIANNDTQIKSIFDFFSYSLPDNNVMVVREDSIEKIEILKPKNEV